MSVVVKRKDGGGPAGYTLMTKGADDAVMAIAANDHVKASVEAHVRTCAEAGLRTLVLTKRDLSDEEYSKWEAKYVEAATALENRDNKIEEAFKSIEKGSRVVGCTGIEDSLQPKVGETIEMCRRGGLTVWMITGDKYETALQISIACSLASPLRAYHVFISGDTSNLLGHSVQEAINTMCMHPGDSYTVFMDGHTLEELCENSEESLLRLGNLASALVCFRVSPSQKAIVAEIVKKDGCTISIGDGGNDVGMLQVSDFGVGLLGKEGNQAAAASDVSVTRFHHLQRLLFIHGRYSYVRAAFVSQFTIYKALLLVFCQICFGVVSASSGISLFDSFSLFGYTTLWTSFPVLFYVLDRDVSQETNLRYPAIYKCGQGKGQFSEKTFVKWFGLAFFQAQIMFWFAFSMQSSYMGVLTHTQMDYKQFGLLVFSSAIFIQSGVLLINSNSITLPNLVVNVASLVLFVFLETAFGWLRRPGNTFAFNYLLYDPAFYLTVLLSLVTALLPPFVAKHVSQIHMPTTVQTAQIVQTRRNIEEMEAVIANMGDSPMARGREPSVPLLNDGTQNTW